MNKINNWIFGIAVNENNVANGRGYYHPQTGEFTWKESK